MDKLFVSIQYTEEFELNNIGEFIHHPTPNKKDNERIRSRGDPICINNQ